MPLKQFEEMDSKVFIEGWGAPLVGVTPIFAVCFWGFEVGKQIARKLEGVTPGGQLSNTGIIFAGGFSALPATAVMGPR